MAKRLTTGVDVPIFPHDLEYSEINKRLQPGMGAEAEDWQRIAEQFNWLLGRGTTLIPAHTPGGITDNLTSEQVHGSAIAAGGVRAWNYKIWPRYQTQDRVWVVTFNYSALGDVLPTAPQFKFSINSTNGTATNVVSPGGVWWYRHFYQERLSSPSNSVEDVALTVTNNGIAGFQVDQIALFELPRRGLGRDVNSGSDLGAHSRSITPGAPIYDPNSSTNRYGINAIAEADVEARKNCKRGAMFHFHADESQDSNAVSTTSTTYVDAFEEAAPALGPMRFEGDTTTAYAWYFRGEAPVSTDITCRLTMESGDTDELTITGSGSPAWSAAGAINIHTEDLSATGGLRSSTWDDIQVEIKSSDGTEVLFWGISIGEDRGS